MILWIVIELSTKCGSAVGLSTDGDNDVEPVPLAIAVVVTFVVTAISVSFLAVMIGLLLNARRSKKDKKAGFQNNYELDNGYNKKFWDTFKFCYHNCTY